MPVKRSTSLKETATIKTVDAKPRAKHHARKTLPDVPIYALADAQAPFTEHPSREEIAVLAYASWELRGRPVGSAENDWLKAEEELRRRLAAPLVSKHTV
jgi:hypothetical protein